jgi:cyanophycinase
MESAISAFDAVGGDGTAQGVFLTVDNPADAALPEIVSQIEACSGFYFVGGQQGRIVQVFRPDEGDTPAYQALLERHGAGAVVSGSSAGAAIMTDPMINGGSSVGAITAGVRSEDGGEGVVLDKGMGLLAGTFVDQHSLARGRWARLLVAVLATEGYDLAMGIDENTALVVEGDSAWVVGASGVTYFNTRGVVRDPAGHAGSGIVLHLLGSGDGVNLSTGEVQVWPDKLPLAGTGEPYSGAEVDLFDRWALLHFLSESAVSADTIFTFRQDGHAFEFLKDPGFEAHSLDGAGVEDTPLGLSVGPFRLSVVVDPSN